MVGVRIQCRLGNQLFQYAFIKSLSENLNVAYILNDSFEEIIIAKYFELEGFSSIKNKLRKFWFKLVSRKYFTSLQTIEVVDSKQINTLIDNNIYSGFFQSELYFNKVQHKINSCIKIKRKYVLQFENLYGKLFREEKTVVVHIRRGDYLELNSWWKQNLGDNNLTLYTSYYLNCLNQIPRIENYKIIFISDDIEFVKNEFKNISNAEYIQNEMIIDFQILTNADICILSNSSFSWWAAYLNEKKSKKVFCPNYWLGYKIKKEFPENIIIDEWIRVDV